jgi:3'(2'), 5'-bisphosphate nucleotidase
LSETNIPFMDDTLLRKVELLLENAAIAIMEVYAGRNFHEKQKPDLSPVTMADQLSSGIINNGLSGLFPGIPVIDEENPIPDYLVRKNWQDYFLLDPLDGTKEFIKRNGEFCINLALIRNNQPVVSWIYHPVDKKGWSCVKGYGIREFGKSEPLTNTYDRNDGDLLKLITSRSHTPLHGLEFIEKLKTRYRIEIARMGSALKQVEVALGNSGIYIRGSGCSEWDTAAGHLMVEESGGEVLQWNLESSLIYNKQSIINPPFIMLSKQWKQSDFKQFIKEILPRAR